MFNILSKNFVLIFSRCCTFKRNSMTVHVQKKVCFLSPQLNFRVAFTKARAQLTLHNARQMLYCKDTLLYIELTLDGTTLIENIKIKMCLIKSFYLSILSSLSLIAIIHDQLLKMRIHGTYILSQKFDSIKSGKNPPHERRQTHLLCIIIMPESR